MKKFILGCILGFTLFMSTVSQAQDLPVNTLTVKPVWINYHAPNNDNKGLFEDLNNAFEVGYNRHFGKYFSLGLPLRIGAANFPIVNANDSVTGYGKSQYYTGLDALLNLHLFRGRMISPFVYAGVGGAMRDFDNFYAQAPLGLGVDFKVNDYLTIVGQTDYRIAFEKGLDNWQHAIGIRACLCGEPKDADKDGVADKDDLCPNDPGTIMGCPDTDADGIADKDDKCPTVAGVMENMGCPADGDKDGVYDRDDACPTVFGTIKGCPDGDKDGVADKDDKCPTVAGTLMGCPDSDRDGIADMEDKCPKEAGPASNGGCPIKVEIADRDKDGVEDSKDPCPDVYGKMNGCPDTDGDGIADNLDRCPNTFGVASNGGCPEIKVEDKKVLDVAMRAVQFESGTAVITKASYKNLNDIVTVLGKYPEMNLSIEGNTDNVGDDNMNQRLSEKRAKACADYLISKGISSSRMVTVGYGETRPIGDNATPAGRQENRRTEFVPIWR
ncbi:MAG: OmpA family protein [Saprospiraceae bacterium]|nr:OmpA family protein [Saprospiraceae bacterium]